tara:strand:+ start:1092 stop:1772 length:681 start_codon:yes stop_codon:yes gene_type:complete
MPNFKEPKQKGFVMRMGFNSKDSDTTFKEKDQDVIKKGPGYTRDGRVAKYPRSSGRFFYNKTKPTAPAPSQPKKVDMGAVKQSFLSSVGPVKPKAKKVTTPAPKKQTKTVKPITRSIAVPKPKPVSIATPKPTASASISAPKPTPVAAPVKTTAVKKSKPNPKKADRSFSKMVKLRTKANVIAGDDSMSDKRKQRKLGRLRRRYDRQAAKQKQSRPSIGNAYKVDL